MIDVDVLGYEFGLLSLPRNKGRCNPFRCGDTTRRRNTIAVVADSKLHSEKGCGSRRQRCSPRTAPIHIPGVTCARNGASATVADAQHILDTNVLQSQIALGKRAHKMRRNQLAPEFDHFGSRYAGLQPGAVMKRGVPVADRRMVTPH